MKDLQPGDHLTHLAKVGSDFASGHGKMHQRRNSNFDEDGRHNSGFQSLLLTKEGKAEPIFKNEAPGGSELLRLFSTTTEKDTPERMVAEMERLDKFCKEIPQQVSIYICSLA